MDYPQLVEVFDASNDLVKELTSLLLLDSLILHYIVKQLAPTRILHDEV